MNLNDTPSRGKLIEADLYTMHQDFEPWVITHVDYHAAAEAATELGTDGEPLTVRDWFGIWVTFMVAVCIVACLAGVVYALAS